ncbi:fibronectin type III domain-containing protein [uncultured Friedmanniella sp.]|uniref:DUF7927 domain-containing protein n=1 Tax=uncultured Friedmanniella sp. TaxID=335381 RepID=UPI0035CC70DD
MPEGRSWVRPLEDRLIRRTAGVVVLTLAAGLLAVTGVTPAAPAAAGTPSGLIGRWKFDAGSGTTAADSVGSKPLTLSGTAGWSTTPIQGASALATNGSNGSAASASSVLTTSSSYTVSAWVKLNSSSGYQTFVSQDGSQVSGFYLQLRGDTGKFAFTHLASDSTAAATYVAGGTVPVLGQWYHLVGVYDSTANTVALYQNGRLQQTTTASGTWAATGTLAVGRGKFGGSVDFVNGTTDDVSVYSGALSASDVEQVTESARWKFEEGSGATTADDSTNGYTATLQNSPAWTPGEIGTYGLLFNGTNAHAYPSSSVIDTSKSFSVSAWARPDGDTSGYNMVASVDGANYSSGFYLQLTDGGRWAFNRSSADVASPVYAASNSTAAAVSGTWYHLVGVYDSVAKTLTLYVNGVKQASVSYTTGWNATGNFIIGRGKVGGAAVGFWNGAIDDVRAYSYVLDDAAVAALAGTAPTAPVSPSATAGGSSVTVTWAAPSSNGGSNITGYVVTPYKDGVAQTPVSDNASTTTRTLTGLTPGSAYRFTVAAVNPIGTSPASAQSTAVTPFDVPGAPTITAATAGDSRVTLTWSAPASTGGSAITGYVVTPYIGSTAQAGTTFSSTATTQTIVALTAGTAYTFKVAAQNAAGTGTPSVASTSATPNANPTLTFAAPPPGVVGTAYSTQLTVNDGTSPFTWSVASGTLPAGISLSSAGLLSGTPTTAASSTFTVQVSDASSQTATRTVTLVVGSTTPAAPAPPTAAAGVTSATVSWTAPASNGSTITGYSVTPYLSGLAQTPTSFDASVTARTITGLTAGGSYTFTVAAVNANGTGAASQPSNAVTAYDVPAAPAISSVTAGDTRVTVSWTAPASNNGRAVTGYVVTPYIGSTAQTATTFASTATTQTVTGLAAGTAYTFTVAAQNAAGTGAQSAASSSVTPNANPTVTSTTPPAGVVGSAFGYQLTNSAGTAPFTWSVTTGSLPAGLTLSSAGLLSGTPTTVGSSTFTVQVSDASNQTDTRSLTVVVTARPATVATPTATAGLTSAVLTWTAPASNGSTITGYVITPYLGGTAQATITVDPSAKTRTLNNLTAGSIYTFTIAALNANGTGTASAASNPVTPYAALNAPTIGSVTAGTTSATLSWAAPTSTGNSAITGYVVTPYIGSTAQTPQTFTGTATTRTLTGLTPGTAYTFTVAAQNNSGTTVVNRIASAGTVATVDGGPSWVDNGSYRSGASAATGFGSIDGVDSTVPSTTPLALFYTERYGWDAGNEMAYAIPVASGIPIKVRLFFANQYSGTTTVGSRVFDVALEGTTVLPAFDVIAAAGGNRIGTMREFTTTSDGTVNLTFTHTPKSDPVVYGVEILQTGTATTGPDSSASAAVTPHDNPTLSFPTPPAGQVAVAYSQQLTVNGGTGPFTWTVLSGTLPAGLTLGGSSGMLSGTPTAAGSNSFTVRVTDASGQTATRDVTLVIAAQPSIAFSPAAGEVGVAYSQQPTLSGGTSPITWSISAGSLPGGLSLNTSTGLVAGTPTASGTFSVTVRVVDANNQVATRTASIVIAPLPTLTSTPPKQYQQAGFAVNFVATGGTSPFSYAVVSGSLPSGVSLSTAGVLSGQTNQGSYSFTVRATDAKGQTADDPVTLVVDVPPVQLVKTASPTSVAPGGTVTFTLTATNISSTSYENTHFYDPLADVLDDATYNANASASAGSVSYSGSTLDWAIPLNAGQSATLTYTVTVASPDPGNQILTGQVDGIYASTSCSGSQRTSACTAAVTVSGLSVTTTANTSSTTPGSTVSYSVVIANTGQTAYASTGVSQNLSGLLDDATYLGNAAATAGAVAYSSPTLTWTGPLAVGASVTVSFSVRVLDPDPGNRSLTVTAVSSAAGSTCPSGSPAASCSSTVPVLVPALAISISADTSTTTPGSTVAFAVTLANTGQTAYTGTTAALALNGSLDDATYVGTTASAGSYSYASGTVTWTGTIAVGATVTLTSTVTVGDPDPGDKSLTAVASSAAAGSTCPAGSTTTACSTTVLVLVPALTIAASADVGSTTPGSVVHYTVLVTNSGQTAYTGAAVSVPLSGVLDDATYNGDVSATPGTASYASPTISWSGDLAVGATATITYAVTVRQPDPGDLSLTSTAVSATPGSTCRSGGSDPRCTTTVPVLIPALTLTNTVDAGATTTPGARVRYTTTVVNTGQTSYSGAVVTIDISDVVDDATYQNDRTASTGTLAEGASSIRWTLSLSAGQSATVTASFRVNDPVTGNKTLVTSATSPAAGSTCPTADAGSSCHTSVAVLVPGLTLSTTADATTVTPGDVVTYTVVATNTGETAFAPAVVTDDLGGLLGDAVYNGDATADTGSGTLSYSAPTLTWSGPLAGGASVTLTFSVTVRDPDPGNKQLVNRVVSSSAGSTCPARSASPSCTATVGVTVPGLTITTSTNAVTTTPGAGILTTVTVSNSGATAYPAASFSTSLSRTLDDATYDAGSVAASSGTAGFSSGVISWTGPLAPGGSATLTYAVTVHTADGGDNRVRSTVVSSARGNNCPSGGADARCSTDVPVARLVLTQTAAEATTTPGSLVHVATTWANTGQVPYTGISVVSPRADTSDDTNPTGDQTTSSGTLNRTATSLIWTGDIPVGGTVTGTRTLRVKDPDPGNKVITATLVSSAPGNNCPDATTDPACTFSVTVLVPALTITKTANTSATVAGGTVGYTITIANSGETAYTGASVSDSLAGVLDDASYNLDAFVNRGTVTYSAAVLSWSGDLAVGQTATITYSLTATSPASGDKTMVNVVTSDTPGSTCPTGGTAAACRSTVVVLTQQLTIVKTASVRNATLGSTVGYSVTVTNSGQTSYSGASFSDSLDGVLDDAGYDADAALSGPGTVGYASGVLSWSGNLSPGASATLTYSVTIDDPSTGDLNLTNTVISPTTGSNCASLSTDTRCTADVAVTNAVTLTLTKTADVLATTAGSVVHYTVTAVNSSATEVDGADFTDSLDGILDDAEIEGTVTASTGTVSLTGSSISWIGNVPAGDSVTVSYAVRVLASTPTPGDMILTSSLTSTAPAASNNCLAGSTDPRCGSQVPVAALVIERYYTQTSTTPGSTIRLNALFTNTGRYAYHGISVSSPTADSSDDAVPVGDQTATSGSLVLTATTLTWTGDIPVGGSVFLTGTLVVKNPDTGNRNITATSSSSALGNNCQAGSPDPRCSSSLPVLLPELTIAKSADVEQAAPGDVVTYTVTVTDSGETPYPGAVVTDDLTDVLDDADWGADATATSGDLDLNGNTLTWTGDVAVAQSVTIVYSVQVSTAEAGNRYLVDQVSTAAVGSNCPADSADAACFSEVNVLQPGLQFSVQSDHVTAQPGQVVTTTITIANDGETTYAAAQVSVALADVLDDASYDGDAAIVDGRDDGEVTVANGVLGWAGSLAPGEGAVVTYSVTVDDPVGGDFRLDQTATSDSLGSSCVSGTADRCASSVPIASLHLSDVASRPRRAERRRPLHRDVHQRRSGAALRGAHHDRRPGCLRRREVQR